MSIKIHRLESEMWGSFTEDWKAQCQSFGEDFSQYEIEPIGVIRELAEGPSQKNVAAFAFHDGKRFAATCQVNCTGLPGYDGIVLRVRMLYLSPYYEYGDYAVEEYSTLITSIFAKIYSLSDEVMPARHIKFHLRSPADRQFFATLGAQLDKERVFKSVKMCGAWLYISKI